MKRVRIRNTIESNCEYIPENDHVSQHHKVTEMWDVIEDDGKTNSESGTVQWPTMKMKKKKNISIYESYRVMFRQLLCFRCAAHYIKVNVDICFSEKINTFASAHTSQFTRYHMYADDLQIYLHFHPDETSDAVNKINEDLNSISLWAHKFGLRINPDKTQEIHNVSKSGSLFIVRTNQMPEEEPTTYHRKYSSHRDYYIYIPVRRLFPYPTTALKMIKTQRSKRQPPTPRQHGRSPEAYPNTNST
ncbi:hypothetical protein ANN_13526 [Periplaneta americana]|uniref:Reverse transcriptase domain-containing protein n=1 Tax=Periplaneta americana TaxID=6978 RepID=A0ABQ8TKM6_PERAM|nr:hypothetical protein ANN_13526 [Periplaneta americana]